MPWFSYRSSGKETQRPSNPVRNSASFHSSLVRSGPDDLYFSVAGEDMSATAVYELLELIP